MDDGSRDRGRTNGPTQDRSMGRVAASGLRVLAFAAPPAAANHGGSPAAPRIPPAPPRTTFAEVKACIRRTLRAVELLEHVGVNGAMPDLHPPHPGGGVHPAAGRTAPPHGGPAANRAGRRPAPSPAAGTAASGTEVADPRLSADPRDLARLIWLLSLPDDTDGADPGDAAAIARGRRAADRIAAWLEERNARLGPLLVAVPEAGTESPFDPLDRLAAFALETAADSILDLAEAMRALDSPTGRTRGRADDPAPAPHRHGGGARR